MQRSSGRLGRPLSAVLVVAAVALVAAGGASAHANVSPAVVKAGASQVFTVAVPTEKENAATTAVTLTPPSNFRIDSFAPSPGWKRKVVSHGSGENVVIERVTWSGGSVPHDEDAVFQFLGSAENAKTYSFTVQQTYSDGSVVDWSGPESSDSPAPTIEAKSSLGGGRTSVLSIVAIALAGVALLVGGIGLLASGGRQLA